MSSKGFTLLEVIIAAFVLITGVVGVYIAFSRIIFVFPVISSRLTAAYLAQEGIEIVRNIRDTNWLEGESWNAGLTFCSVGCEGDYKTGTPEGEANLWPYKGDYLYIDSDDFYSYSLDGTPTKFKREITITPEEDNILKASVLIEWQVKGKPYNFEVEEYLYNYRY